MKYNSTLLNKIFNTSNNTTNNNNNNNSNNNINSTINIINSTSSNNDSIKVSPPTTSNPTMAAVINNTPISNSMIPSTRFTDEYEMKDELGKWVFATLFFFVFLFTFSISSSFFLFLSLLSFDYFPIYLIDDMNKCKNYWLPLLSPVFASREKRIFVARGLLNNNVAFSLSSD